MKLRSVSLLIIASNLSGCISWPVKTEYIDVPTPVSCISWEPTPTPSVFNALQSDSVLLEQVRALLIDRENDKTYIEGQQAVINGCKD